MCSRVVLVLHSLHSLYLHLISDCSQSVRIDETSSHTLPLLRGIPQGSILGPLLFTLYTTLLGYVLGNSSLSYHFYADDSQLYVSFNSSDSNASLAALSRTPDHVYAWFCANRLSVNPSKTEYLLIGTPQQRLNVANSSISFQNLELTPTEAARNLE